MVIDIIPTILQMPSALKIIEALLIIVFYVGNIDIS